MRFGSLFTGVGGFDLALERAGMSCAWQAEIDSHATKVLETRWPDTTRYKDVKDVGKHSEAVELICGGFPCQDLSVAGKRAGLAGERSGPWFEFARIIGELSPRWVVIENVPGLLSSNKGRDMGILTGSLAQLGYWWAYRVLDSQYFGVAQRRRRVFIVGHLTEPTYPAKILFEPESRDWDTAPRRETREENPRIAGTLSANGGGTDSPAGNANELDFVVPDVAYSIRANSSRSGDKGDGGLNTTLIPEIARAITSREGHRQKVDQETYMVVPRTFTVRGGNGVGGKGYLENVGGSMTIGGQSQWVAESAYPLRSNRRNNSDGGVNARQMVYEKVGVRRLTPTECERLQGFPDGWTEEQSDTQRYKMMGNAVTVNVVEWIGKRIVELETA